MKTKNSIILLLLGFVFIVSKTLASSFPIPTIHLHPSSTNFTSEKAVLVNNHSNVVTTRIIVPEDGYLSFNWNTDDNIEAELTVLANGIKLPNKKPFPNFYLSDKLSKGDVLNLSIEGINTQAISVLLSNMHLFNNVLINYEQEDISSFPPLNSTPFPTLDQLRLPDSKDGIESSTLLKNESIHPDQTGYPKIDLDGYWQTEKDQRSLVEIESGFLITWDDEFFEDGAWIEVQRKWLVTNLFSGNQLIHTQTLRMPSEGVSVEDLYASTY
jgi:hypothetical protein